MKFLENQKYVQRTVAQMYQVKTQNIMNEILLNISKLKNRRKVIYLTNTTDVLRYVYWLVSLSTYVKEWKASIKVLLQGIQILDMLTWILASYTKY